MTDPLACDLIYPDWLAPESVRAFTTTRRGGVSQGPWSSLNLGVNCGDKPVHVQKNRTALLALLPGEPRWLNQVHGTTVVNWNDSHDEQTAADAVTSDQAGQVCAVMTADCLPVLFCNKKGTKVTAAHAGWRGLAAGILEASVAAMDCDPSELMAWMGPAIGPRSFEVGEDVYAEFVQQEVDNKAAFKPHKDRWLADLYGLARLALARVGLGQVSGGRYCTYSESDNFFSYRRDKETGRMASMIWLES